MEIPVPCVRVAAAGFPVLEPMGSWPSDRVIELRAVVAVAPDMTTPVVLNEVAPVPPPATSAVVKLGLAELPLLTKGIPDVADGTTFAMWLLVLPTRTLYWVVVEALKVPAPS
jgi:hypothetical protein